MTITIIGETLAGKTTTGYKLAKALDNYEIIDLDSEFIKKYGELHKLYETTTQEEMLQMFIDLYEDISKKKNTIIITGGYFGTTYEGLQQQQKVINLHISKNLFIERVIEQAKEENRNKQENKNRRIIQKYINNGIKELHEHYDKRKENYQKFANYNITFNSNKELNAKINKLIKQIKNNFEEKKEKQNFKNKIKG